MQHADLVTACQPILIAVLYFEIFLRDLIV
jgi:hypothetical protein